MHHLEDNLLHFVVKVLKAADFRFETAKNSIANIDLPELANMEKSAQERLRYLASIVDFDNTQMVSSSRKVHCLHFHR